SWRKKLSVTSMDSKEIFRKAYSIIHPDDLENLKKISLETRQKKEAKYSYEYRIRKPDGQYIWTLSQVKFIYNKKGKAIKAYGTHIDITDKKLAIEKLKESEGK